MTNSMNSYKEHFQKLLNVEIKDSPADMQLIIDVNSDKFHQTLIALKTDGFRQLSILTCIDWIELNKFQLVAILMNWDTGMHLLVRTLLDRDNPDFHTITSIYPGAIYYEREIFEFFGVHFKGNPTYDKPLFLERWDAMPPLRKDFDPQAYSDSKFPKREHPHVFKAQVVEEIK